MIPKNLEFRLKLLYRGSRDGLGGPAFHQRCDGIRNTISVIKCKFKGASNSSLISDFLDGGVGTLGYGPCFGGWGKYDIGILYQEGRSECWVKPYTYSEASQIVDSQGYSGSGRINFTLEDTEVFCLQEKII